MSALVLTNDRPEPLRRALDSLSASATAVKTIVIDNGSRPVQARRVAAICSGRQRLVLKRSDCNLGCAGGRRLATDLADTEFVLFLDDNAELMPGALDHLVAELDQHRDAEAVAATVVNSDGLVSHSGGAFACDTRTINFSLCEAGAEFDFDALPASGSTAWIPGTAMLVRRALLEAFPLDEQMAASFEDYEWCYRVSRARPACFRRSREALAFHQASASRPQTADMPGLAYRVDLLTTLAHFHERHGLFIGPALFETVPELCALDGTYEHPGARLLMELITAKGSQWTLEAWRDGELTGLLNARRREAEIERQAADIERQAAEIERQAELLDWLHERHETLCRIEQGGWWRLRGRILPLILIAGTIRRVLGRVDERPPT